MARGDVVHGLSDVNSEASLLIQPGVGVEWIIHNVYHEGYAQLKIREGGVNELLFDTDTSAGSWSAYFFHLTNDHYLSVKNKEVTTKKIGYDGIVSKE
jgi:hypothetical protein